jgi:hypothetical protein
VGLNCWWLLPSWALGFGDPPGKKSVEAAWDVVMGVGMDARAWYGWFAMWSWDGEGLAASAEVLRGVWGEKAEEDGTRVEDERLLITSDDVLSDAFIFAPDTSSLLLAPVEGSRGAPWVMASSRALIAWPCSKTALLIPFSCSSRPIRISHSLSLAAALSCWICTSSSSRIRLRSSSAHRRIRSSFSTRFSSRRHSVSKSCRTAVASSAI